MKELFRALGKVLWNVVSFIGLSILWIISLVLFIVATAIAMIIVIPILTLVHILKDDASATEAYQGALEYVIEYWTYVLNTIGNVID